MMRLSEAKESFTIMLNRCDTETTSVSDKQTEERGRITMACTAGRRKCRKMPFLSLVTLTFDLDIQLIRAKDQARLPGELGSPR